MTLDDDQDLEHVQAESRLPDFPTSLPGHGVSQQHLQAYLNEYVFRFNRRFYPFNAFNSVLGIAARTEGPTYRELYDGQWVHPNPMGR